MSAEDARRTLTEYANELATLDEISAQINPNSGGEVTLPTGVNLQQGSIPERLLLKILNELKETCETNSSVPRDPKDPFVMAYDINDVSDGEDLRY